MIQRQLSQGGPEVSEIGFGAWAIGGGWGTQDDRTSKQALHAAIDAGINLIDTAAKYGDGHSERLVAGVVSERADTEVYVTTKTAPAPGPWPAGPYCRWQDRYSAAYLRNDVEQRLRSLNTDRIDLLQLHTWTRAWNDDPQPLLVLRQLRDEGKIRLIGVSAPDQDQDCVIQLMRDGLVDVVQVIFNLFEQGPAAQLLPVAAETGTGVIVRVPLDEGSLADKFSKDHEFDHGDFRRRYFAGDRLHRTIGRVEAIGEDLRHFALLENYSFADVALKFVLSRPEVSCAVVGMRNVNQVTMNTRVSRLRDLPEEALVQLRRHHWLRGRWYDGK